MKITVIGVGQCGSQIADQFARLNRRARSQRGLTIVPDAFAVNTGIAELERVQHIPSDYRHRILIGGGRTRGHGAAKIGETGAQVAREDRDKVITAVRETKRFHEADAILVVAATGGGTGSGAMPILAEAFKERFWSKPVYCMAVLPFEHEEDAEARTIYNTALCLKASHSVADAVFLVENQRFLRKDSTLRYNNERINELIVEPFYNLLCAGEERNAKRIGTRVLDAADITETLGGWTTIGYGRSLVDLITLPFESDRDYRKSGARLERGRLALDDAISSLSAQCNPAEATSALYLVSAPAVEMQANLLNELSQYLRNLAPNAMMRIGDYPDERGVIDVVVILSRFTRPGLLKKYFQKATTLLERTRKREAKVRRPFPPDEDDAAAQLPTLL